MYCTKKSISQRSIFCYTIPVGRRIDLLKMIASTTLEVLLAKKVIRYAKKMESIRGVAWQRKQKAFT